jgi:phytoene dehydrogenase-like protein
MSDVAIVGGGIGGLIAAVALARRGLRPVVFEAAPELGGRAQTRVVDGFCFNQGPHALYLAGALKAALDDVGVPAPGGGPRLSDGLALWGDETHPLPVGRVADIAPPLSAADTRCLADTFARVGAGDYGGPGRPLRAFTGGLPPKVGAVIEALIRNSTYSHAPEDIDAKAALDQLRLGYRGVSYVDGGWRTLIAGLAGAATTAGADLRREQPIVGLRRERGRWLVEAAGQVAARFEAVIVAASPEVARELVSGSAEIAAAARSARSVRAMTLDLGLATVGPGATYALGIDAPMYLSLHSVAAQLAPPGAGLLHLSRFLAPHEAPDAAHFGELERLADRVQPGWRERVTQRQRLVGITVAHDFPRWRSGGRRAEVVVADAPGLFLAGDWVGDEGLLSDASAASATLAAREAAGLVAGVPAQG